MSSSGRFGGKILIMALLSLLTFGLMSCRFGSSTRIYLNDSISWARTDAHSNVYSAAFAEFKELRKARESHKRCFEPLVGRDGAFIWLKMEFTVPEMLRYKSLGLVIPYLHFSDKVWLNNVYVGGYGEFPPNEKSSLFQSHLYYFPNSMIRQEGVNTILVKVWVHGRGDISDFVFVDEYDSASRTSDMITFWNVRMYIMFSGVMLCAFILYLLMYIGRRNEKDNLSFSLLNLSTVCFLLPFCASDVPIYDMEFVSYFLFIKLALCISFFFVVTFASLFMMQYLRVRISPPVRFAMPVLLLTASGACLFAPDYNFLMRLTIPCLVMMAFQLGFGIREVVRAFFGSDAQARTSARILAVGFLPTICTILADFILRDILMFTAQPYISIFGWQVSLFVFIMILTVRYNRVYRRNEILSFNLDTEVRAKTKRLSEANERLELEMRRSNVDLEMASIVQKKFFPLPEVSFIGWDVAIAYEAAAKVSGDLFDYYHEGRTLRGMSLFDVSGHGIAASLITMLSKHIVYESFRDSNEKARSISTALYRVNEQIIEAKGDIENYLTGLLIRFTGPDENGTCGVEMANAGHPHPILFRAATSSVCEIVHDEGQFQYGAIGIRDIDVSFPEIRFPMEEGDVFVCFTDGLTEAMNEFRDQFGKERVMEILRASGGKDAKAILDDLVSSLFGFIGEVPRDDDMTIIVLRRTGIQDDGAEELLEEL
ncbi:PP2C family protein-serine/threonine phosphatase [Treponema saccharophilum]|uniref:PP2C family protein-serine/threonine phosphatase n=1 Tax=Treponema saccharophilum TaxID=165 RepID=UPI00386B911D